MKSNKFPCLWEMLTFYDGGQVQLVPKWVVLNTRIDSINEFVYLQLYIFNIFTFFISFLLGIKYSERKDIFAAGFLKMAQMHCMSHNIIEIGQSALQIQPTAN